jgi:hypothetical protein
VFRPIDLIGIANTDVVVTMSEACTSCAVGVVEISNIRASVPPAAGSINNEADLSITSIATFEQQIGGVALIGSTCATGGGTEIPDFTVGGPGGNSGDSFQGSFLYFENNAEIDFAASYYIFPTAFLSDGAVRSTHNVLWSGAGVSNAAGLFFI